MTEVAFAIFSILGMAAIVFMCCLDAGREGWKLEAEFFESELASRGNEAAMWEGRARWSGRLLDGLSQDLSHSELGRESCETALRHAQWLQHCFRKHWDRRGSTVARLEQELANARAEAVRQQQWRKEDSERDTETIRRLKARLRHVAQLADGDERDELPEFVT